MGCRVINNIKVNLSGNNISDEELAIHLNAVQATLKRKIAKVDVSVDSEGVDIDYIYTYPLIKNIRRIPARCYYAKQAEERERIKLN